MYYINYGNYIKCLVTILFIKDLYEKFDTNYKLFGQ